MTDTLSSRITELSKIFDLDGILERRTANPKEIAKYYRKNRLAYRVFNNHEGFVHMGISEVDQLNSEDFYKQALIVGDAIHSISAKHVLELAPGKATTIKYLAKKYPKTQFVGLDLAKGQLKAKKSDSNLSLRYGDYHDLSSYKEGTIDLVYVIEALCHAYDKKLVIAEVSRVLRPGGLFVVIDGYYSKNPSTLNKNEKLACDLAAQSMMVTTRDQTYGQLKELLKDCGFSVKDEKNYSKNILPSLYRLEDMARRLIQKPKTAKVITLGAGEIVTANAIAGYLMPLLVTGNLFEYRYTLAIKDK